MAQGRNLPLATVDKIAKGRVWSGEQAKGLGLVDDLGGADRAVTVAKELAHIPVNRSVEIVRLPKEKTLFDLFLERAQGQVVAQENDYSSIQSLVRRVSSMVQAEPVRAQMPYVLRIR